MIDALELKNKRIYKADTYTIGKLYNITDSDKYICDTLEDKDRGLNDKMSEAEIKKIKVHSQTAIPTGRYEIILANSPKFGKDTPLLLNVPGFSGILIHAGNTIADTSGCLLVGENKAIGKVLNSKATLAIVLNLIRSSFKSGKRVFITFE